MYLSIFCRSQLCQSCLRQPDDCHLECGDGYVDWLEIKSPVISMDGGFKVFTAEFISIFKQSRPLHHRESKEAYMFIENTPKAGIQ
jgi:hypothetical protein